MFSIIRPHVNSGIVFYSWIVFSSQKLYLMCSVSGADEMEIKRAKKAAAEAVKT